MRCSFVSRYSGLACFEYCPNPQNTFSSKGAKNDPIKGVDDKRQITATLAASSTGSFCEGMQGGCYC